MPRRWTNSRRTRPAEPEEPPAIPQSYEAMARDLVRRGLAAPSILSISTRTDYTKDD